VTGDKETSIEEGREEVEEAPEEAVATPSAMMGLPPPPDEPSEALPTDSLAPSKMPEKHSLEPGPRPIGKAELWASGVWYAGVILWSYVVVGEYVVGAELPEVLGWSCFVGLLVGTFLQGANRIGVPLMRRTAALGFGGVVVLVLFISSIFGTSRRSDYQGTSAFLLLVAVLAVIFGVLRANKLRVQAGASKKKPTFAKVATWVIFAGNSLLILTAFLSQT
jgi:hypothetical protein